VAGALAASALRPPGERRHAAAGVTAGAALASLPVAALYASRGGMGVLYRQVVEASLFRGAATRAQSDGGGEWARRLQVIAAGTEGHTWLLAVALAGLAVFTLWMRTPRVEGTREMAAALAVYHYGILAFSLRDFQVYGDLFALLHTAAFFGAVAAGEIYLWLRRQVRTSRLAPVAALLACVAIGRPWVDRGALRVPGLAGSPLTLAGQGAAAAALHPRLAPSTTAVLGASELLFLDGKRNPLPFVVWNPAVYSYFRRGPDEDRTQTLARLMDEAGIERLVCVRDSPRCGGLLAWERVMTVGGTPGYAVDVYERRAPGGTTPRNRAP
jgi:hypothetical protein